MLAGNGKEGIEGRRGKEQKRHSLGPKLMDFQILKMTNYLCFPHFFSVVRVRPARESGCSNSNSSFSNSSNNNN